MPGNCLRPINANWAPQRLSLFFSVFLLLAVALVIRLLNLGIVHGEEYARFSESNFLRERTIDAPRGTIQDRNGNILAYNRATFEVSMSPASLTTATVQVSLDRLGQLLGADLSSQVLTVAQLRPRWKSQVISRRLSLDLATQVFERRYSLPGVAVDPQFQRYYPYGSTLCHVLGHVGKIPPNLVARFRQEGYELDDQVGVAGIEAAFEDSLKGQKGLEQVWRTNRGRILDSQVLQPPTPGGRLTLTIDLKLQQLAESLLLGQRGVILALDPRNGEMLAWASSPGYDPNRPADIDNPTSKPWVNRAIQEYYRPGSSFKIITAVAALEAGWNPAQMVNCDHSFRLPNWGVPFMCLGWHDSLNLVGAFQHSCNIYFYTMANFVYTRDPQDAGYQLVRTAERFGFASPTEVLSHETESAGSGLRERPGRLPTMGNFRAERGSVLHTAIGQGRVDVTPLQMILAYAAIANGGELLAPRLLRQVVSERNEVIVSSEKVVRRNVGLKPEHRRVIVEGLLAAVNAPGGTAHDAGFLPEWRVAGKTSTAERNTENQPDAWFIGFAPGEKPELAVLVMIEQGGHGGTVSAPLAAKLFAAYFSAAGPTAPTTLASYNSTTH